MGGENGEARWHVLVDDDTGKRSCYFGLWEALALNDAGKFVPAC